MRVRLYRRPCSSRVWSATSVGTLPSFSGLGAAPIAAGRCISAGAPSRPLTRVGFLFKILFVRRILRLYSILVFTKNPSEVCSLVLGFVFRFCCSFVRALMQSGGTHMTWYGILLLHYCGTTLYLPRSSTSPHSSRRKATFVSTWYVQQSLGRRKLFCFCINPSHENARTVRVPGIQCQPRKYLVAYKQSVYTPKGQSVPVRTAVLTAVAPTEIPPMYGELASILHILGQDSCSIQSSLKNIISSSSTHRILESCFGVAVVLYPW